jgi:DNA primase
MNIFETVKSSVTAREAAEHYGIQVNKNGMCKCPFHADRNPSMKVDCGFYCFGCQEKGDVIRFVSRLFNIPPYEAAWKLISDMGIDVADIHHPTRTEPAPEENTSGQWKEALRKIYDKQFEQTVSRMCDTYCNYLQLLNEWQYAYAPRSPDEELHPLFVESAHKRDYVEYLIDILQFGSKEDQALLVIEKRKEAKELEKRIERIESGDGERPAGGIAVPAG